MRVHFTDDNADVDIMSALGAPEIVYGVRCAALRVNTLLLKRTK